MLRISSKVIFSFLICSWLIQPAFAVKIVRLDLEYGSDTVIATGGFDIPRTNKVLDLELNEDATPITVANFLNYVNSGRYDQTFFNRNIPGFVLQTGGVNNISADPENEGLGNNTFGEVEEFPPILNEPGLQNLRGTIAMAKLADQPDSANSEWFINLTDNSDTLDVENGGITVFGSIIDDGMETVDQIEAFPVDNIGFIFGPSFTNVPFADFDFSSSETRVQSNLVMILKATNINRPILRFSHVNADFGIDVTSDTSGKLIDVVLTNTGNEDLQLGSFSASEIDAPFSIKVENCTNKTLKPVSLAPLSSCTLSLQFLAKIPGEFSNILVVNYSSSITDENFSVKFQLLGEGSPIGVAEIATVKALDIGTSQLAGFVMSKELKVNNVGQAPLQIVAITGINGTEFRESNDCLGNGTLIPPGGFCTITVRFTPFEFGTIIKTLSIESTDPANNIVKIKLSGFGDNDSDGVLSAVEDAAPNAGDGNFDDAIDSRQNNVASFIDQTGEYISLVVDDKYVVTNISVTSFNLNSDFSEGKTFKHGALEYDVILDSPGEIVNIGLVLPPGDSPDAIYLFGQAADTVAPNWYQYPVTEIFSNINLSSSVKSLMKLTVQDGGAGDADQEINGRIHIGPALISYSTSSDKSSGSGAINVILMVFLLMTLALFSKRY
jgi:cyclophilin family peptidyl-prolyl cis-trans isomerase